MAAFRFRAQAALDLRRKEEDAAQRALGEARLAAEAAEARLRELGAAVAQAVAAAGDAEAVEPDVAVRMWHRSWIERHRLDVVQQAGRVAECLRIVRDAQGLALRARRKRRALELYRERMWRAYAWRERRAEQKAIDDLATLRFVAHRTIPEGEFT